MITLIKSIAFCRKNCWHHQESTKMRCSVKDFFSKYEQIHSFLCSAKDEGSCPRQSFYAKFISLKFVEQINLSGDGREGA